MHKSEYRTSWQGAWFFRALFTVVVHLKETSETRLHLVLSLCVSVTSYSFIISPPSVAFSSVEKHWTIYRCNTSFQKGQDVIFMENFEICHWAISCLFGEICLTPFFVRPRCIHFEISTNAVHWFCWIETTLLKVQLGSYGQICITYHDLPMDQSAQKSGISSKVVM